MCSPLHCTPPPPPGAGGLGLLLPADNVVVMTVSGDRLILFCSRAIVDLIYLMLVLTLLQQLLIG